MKKKKLYIISVTLLLLSIAGFVVSAILMEYNANLWWTVLVSTDIFIAIFILTCISYFPNAEFICKQCNKQFKPTFNSSFWSIHLITKRYLRCPHCNKLSWAKETWNIEKDN